MAIAAKEGDRSQQLETIFVMPDVLEEAKPELPLSIADFEKAANKSKRQPRSLQGLERGGRSLPAEEILELAPSPQKNQQRRVVILGEPGSGKTTLLAHFAVELAKDNLADNRANNPAQNKLAKSAEPDLLPILISVRDLVGHLDVSILDYLRQFAEKNLEIASLPGGFFEYWLEGGRALILLDGLDEAASETKRRQIAERIELFLAEYPRNPAIITSRPAGYRHDFFRTADMPHYTMQPFDDAKIEEFIDNWYESRIEDPQEAGRWKKSLKNALDEQEAIKQLTRNPLLLTIISLIHRYEAHLPKERYKLYESAVQTLLINWDKKRELEPRDLEYLVPNDFKRLMERLAYWVHCQAIAGEEGEGGTLIEREELIEQLTQYIKELKPMKQLQRYEAKLEAGCFVDYIRERTGLLNEYGVDKYAFVHKTFQEYLAAEEIRYRQEDDDFEEVLEHIEKYLHNSHWREVLLLLIAQQKPKKATKVLRKILEQPTPYESWLHRNLFFAGRCLAEDIEVSDPDLVKNILEQFVDLEAKGHYRVGDRVRSEVFKVLSSLSQTQFDETALELLQERLRDSNKGRLPKYWAAFATKEVATKAILLMLKDESDSVRGSAASALGKLGGKSEAVISKLLSLLKDESDSVRVNAASALGKLGGNSEAVISELLSLLKNESEDVRINAASALGKLRGNSEAVIPRLLSLLKDRSYWVRGEAANALGKLEGDSEALVSGLLSLLKDESEEVRRSAAYALGKLKGDSEAVVPELLPLLKDESDWVCGIAVYVLGKLGDNSEAVITELLPLLKNESKWVRAIAAVALGELGGDSEAVVPGLLALLKDKSEWVRAIAALALSELGSDSEAVVPGLLFLLKDESNFVRAIAMYALSQLGGDSEAVVPELLSLLKDENDLVRGSAASALRELGGNSEAVIPGLLSLLKDDSDLVRSKAADALVKLGKSYGKGAEAIIAQWIEDNRDFENLGDAIDTLWDITSEEEKN
ncbi:MAG: NACHT domain-containing protein [Oscillatoria sp. SIO1A7]|nr:NACHT domain-containing protein [Oscillatoria sp. SIO1A7]